MLMPKTTMNKNYLLPALEYQIRMTRELSIMQTISVSQTMDEFSYNQFRFGIRTPDKGHPSASLFWSELIITAFRHHLRLDREMGCPLRKGAIQSLPKYPKLLSIITFSVA
jgi:hypothetical protein